MDNLLAKHERGYASERRASFFQTDKLGEVAITRPTPRMVKDKHVGRVVAYVNRAKEKKLAKALRRKGVSLGHLFDPNEVATIEGDHWLYWTFS